MIASHHYYVSINKKPRNEENFCKTFFELNREWVNTLLQNLQISQATSEADLNIKLENKEIKKTQHKKQKKLVDEIAQMHTHLTSNDNIEYLDKWVKMNELVLPLWKRKIEQDKQIIHNMFSVPIAVMVIPVKGNGKQVKKNQKIARNKQYQVKFSFLPLDNENQCSY